MISNISVYINALANLSISLSMIFFMIFVFGSNNKMINSLPKHELMLIKSGLALISCGSLLSFLTLSNPPFTEILMNVGLALTFIWAAIFHYKYFIKR